MSSSVELVAPDSGNESISFESSGDSTSGTMYVELEADMSVLLNLGRLIGALNDWSIDSARALLQRTR